jgi:hypothetical protein
MGLGCSENVLSSGAWIRTADATVSSLGTNIRPPVYLING